MPSNPLHPTRGENFNTLDDTHTKNKQHKYISIEEEPTKKKAEMDVCSNGKLKQRELKNTPKQYERRDTYQDEDNDTDKDQFN